MAGEVQRTGNSNQQAYKTQIEQALNRIDSNGDGKVTVDEALNNLDIGSMLSGLDEKSKEYKKLKRLTDKIPKALEKCAGDDGIFQAEEWENFLKGKKWAKVTKAYQSSSNYISAEMSQIDQSCQADGNCTTDEVKAVIINAIKTINPDADCSKIEKWEKIEKIIDKCAGDDGIFTPEEYAKLKNKSKYAKFLKKYNIESFGL